jgi:hypothetical protein
VTAVTGDSRVTGSAPPPAERRGQLDRWWHSRFGARFGRELLLVVGLLVVYKYGRHLGTSGHIHEAIGNAREVIDFERSLGVFTEARLQELVDGNVTVVRFLNGYYLVAHVLVTVVAFFWLYARHLDVYRRFRNVMVVMTLVGLAVHLGFPLAPPRMFPKFGFVDTARIFGPAAYGNGSPYKGFANQFAAMPSLHFGWALVIAWAVFLATRSRWRSLVLLHPFLTLAAIVLTANHYWTDAAAALLLFVIALAFDHVWERVRNRRIQRRVASPAVGGNAGELSPRVDPEGAGIAVPGSRTTPACRD